MEGRQKSAEPEGVASARAKRRANTRKLCRSDLFNRFGARQLALELSSLLPRRIVWLKSFKSQTSGLIWAFLPTEKAQFVNSTTSCELHSRKLYRPLSCTSLSLSSRLGCSAWQLKQRSCLSTWKRSTGQISLMTYKKLLSPTTALTVVFISKSTFWLPLYR